MKHWLFDAATVAAVIAALWLALGCGRDHLDANACQARCGWYVGEQIEAYGPPPVLRARDGARCTRTKEDEITCSCEHIRGDDELHYCDGTDPDCEPVPPDYDKPIRRDCPCGADDLK